MLHKEDSLKLRDVVALKQLSGDPGFAFYLWIFVFKHRRKLIRENETGSHQAEDGRERSPLVVAAAAEFEIEQQSVVRHQVKAVCVHQRLAAQSVACLETWGVNPACRDTDLGLQVTSVEDVSVLSEVKYDGLYMH